MLTIDDFGNDRHRWIIASKNNKRLWGYVMYKYGKCHYEVEVDNEIVARCLTLKDAINQYNKV